MSKIKRGQGLSALLGSIDVDLDASPSQEIVSELTENIAEIPIVQIEVNPFQPRVDFDREALEDLSESIKVHGLIQPITVRRLENNKYQLISGERRLRASVMAGKENIPAYIRIANDQEMLEMALIENIQREDLNSIEVALTYSRLKEECQLTDENLAERVGKKRSTISNYLRLLKLPPTIQLGIKEQRISMGHARALTAITDLGLQLTIFNEILNKGLSVRQVEDMAAGTKEDKSAKKPTPSLPDDFMKVQDRLRSVLAAKVTIKRDPKGKGSIQIPFMSDKDLNRLLDLLEKE